MGPGRGGEASLLPALILGLPLSGGLRPVCWEPPTPPTASAQPVLSPCHWDLLQLQDATHELSQVTFTSFLPLLPDTQGRHLCTFDFFSLLPLPPHMSPARGPIVSSFPVYLSLVDSRCPRPAPVRYTRPNGCPLSSPVSGPHVLPPNSF